MCVYIDVMYMRMFIYLIHYAHIPPSILYILLFINFWVKFSLLLDLEEVIKERTMQSNIAQFFHDCSLNTERGRQFSKGRF